MCKIFPELKDKKIDYSWCGKVAYTFDHTPHLGKQDGLYYAIGYCGSGVTRSIYLARQLSRKILGQGDHETAFDDLGFKSKPFYTGTPLLLPIVLKWHSFLDRMDGN
jgi:glycine/D-amino acid oxidase-like deaminating enzyme